MIFEKPNDYKFTALEDWLIARLMLREAPFAAPFDLYCPSMVEKFLKCICKTFSLYCPSEAALKLVAKLRVINYERFFI